MQCKICKTDRNFFSEIRNINLVQQEQLQFIGYKNNKFSNKLDVCIYCINNRIENFSF